MHAHNQMEDWIVYLIVFGTVALLLMGKYLLMTERKKKK